MLTKEVFYVCILFKCKNTLKLYHKHLKNISKLLRFKEKFFINFSTIIRIAVLLLKNRTIFLFVIT
jgi:hypothetical protein